MEDIELLSYLLVFAVSIIFSAFAVDRKSSIFSWVSAVSWGVLSTVHLKLAYTSDFIVLAFLFSGCTIIFAFYGFALVIWSFRTAKAEREWQL